MREVDHPRTACGAPPHFALQGKRWVGAEDGSADARFDFMRPVGGAYRRSPPMRHGRFELRGLGQ